MINFIDKELILVIGDFFANIEMANNYVDMPIIATAQDKETQEERCGSSNCQYKIHQLLLTNKFAKYCSHQSIILYGNTENIGSDKGQKIEKFLQSKSCSCAAFLSAHCY